MQNVGLFIKEHGLGQRHANDKSRDAVTSPTTVHDTTLYPGSTKTSFRAASVTPSDRMKAPKSGKPTMMALSFKKMLQ